MDPYDNDDIFPPVIFSSSAPASEEEKIYHELIGLYQGCINENGQCHDSFLWESVNKAMDSLIARSYADYEKFKIEPSRLGGQRFISYSSFKAQLMSALHRMHKDFDFSDPSYLIHVHLPKSGTMITNSANSSPMQNNNQNQSQQQSQETSVSITQRVEMIEQQLEENLTEEQLENIRPVLEEFKKEPTKWSIASKLINAVLGLSKDIAIAVISNIIATQLQIAKMY